MQHVIIQAGGRGTRMEMLTENKPKALLPFGDKTLLQSIMDEYPAGTHFVIILDHLADVAQRYIADVLSGYDLILL